MKLAFIGVVVVMVLALAVVSYLQGGFKANEATSVSTTMSEHIVSFRQSPACGSQYAVPWSVTIGNTTITKPANATLPTSPYEQDLVDLHNAGLPMSMSVINFSLPDGTYHYELKPVADFNSTISGASPNGTFSVSGKDVMIGVLIANPVKCGP